MVVMDKLLGQHDLVKLTQPDNFVGWIYSIDYDTALMMTNDLWKARASGIPHNCFLVASSFNPEEFSKASDDDKEVILLRVIGSTKLPQHDDLVKAKIDSFQSRTEVFDATNSSDFDHITLNQLQFGGLKCHVLGTFYFRDDAFWLGSDLESFANASRLNVYRPRGEALEMIVNYVDPIRRQKAIEDTKDAGIEKPIEPFQVGTVRYTSTDRLHRKTENDKVSVFIQPTDFLARRTAVLGMTRTGKSNMVKQTVSVVKRMADESNVKIGQIIYDINGEYANANQQDAGALGDIYKDDTVRYRMMKTKGFEELQNNFYIQLDAGYRIIRDILVEKKLTDQADMQTFVNTAFDEPDEKERGLHSRWQVRVAAYQTMLYEAGFEPPDDLKIRFPTNPKVRKLVQDASVESLEDPSKGLSLIQARDWFLAARKANEGTKNKLESSTKGKAWLDNDTRAILNLLARLNDGGTYIKGYNNLVDAIQFHSNRRRAEVGDEIYDHLINGKIVILDLSVGNPELRDRISKQIAADIFNKSMYTFVEGKMPPNIVCYVEEAHNLIGRGMKLTETWPRLAKEGAKYRIALVYATQEVSSVHPNILSNTENWFITHLNNRDEIKSLAKFYDFEDFSRSLLGAQDVGFARVKTLSGPFVIPVQIDKFDPEAEVNRVAEMTAAASSGNADPKEQQPSLFTG